MGDTAGATVAACRDDDAYRRVAAGLQHAIALGAIALEYGHPCRAERHILGALADLEPELRAMFAATLPPP